MKLLSACITDLSRPMIHLLPNRNGRHAWVMPDQLIELSGVLENHSTGAVAMISPTPTRQRCSTGRPTAAY
jgi:hypothetical protein